MIYKIIYSIIYNLRLFINLFFSTFLVNRPNCLVHLSPLNEVTNTPIDTENKIDVIVTENSDSYFIYY